MYERARLDIIFGETQSTNFLIGLSPVDTLVKGWKNRLGVAIRTIVGMQKACERHGSQGLALWLLGAGHLPLTITSLENKTLCVTEIISSSTCYKYAFTTAASVYLLESR